MRMRSSAFMAALALMLAASVALVFAQGGGAQGGGRGPARRVAAEVVAVRPGRRFA